MKKLQELSLSPGEIVFVDSLHSGVARLVIGKEGERVESVYADALPKEGHRSGITLRVQPDGTLKRDEIPDKAATAETTDLMSDVFGGPPPE
jgi:hypothetical protein